MAIFHGIQLGVAKVCFNILTRLKEYICGSTKFIVRVTYPLVGDISVVTGFFDGSEQKGEFGQGWLLKCR